MAWRTLPPGSYSWAVSYVDRAGKTLSSNSRRFEVLAGAESIVLPSAASVVTATAAKARPRMLPAGSSFASIQSLAMAGELKTSYAAFLKRADTALPLAPRANPDPNQIGQKSISALTAAQANNSVTHTAEDERQDIEALAYVGRFKNDSRYTNAALTRLMSIAAWNPNGQTSESNQDQANRQVYLALAQGLDLLADKMTAEQTSLVVSALRTRLQQAMANFAGLDTYPYNSHLLTSMGFITEALLYSAGHPGFPEAKTWLATAYELWITNLTIWGGYDGGFGNSTAYGWYTLSSVPRQLATLKLVTGFDLSSWQAIAKWGDQYMAMTPAADGLRSPFGDDAEVLNQYSSNGFDGYRMLAGLTRNATQEWYWRQLASNVNTAYPLPPAHYMLLGLNATRPPPLAPSRNSFIFEDAGLVAIHSKTADPARSSIYFRSSALGSLNHSHADNNAFTLVSKGRDLLISAGYYPYYDSPHHLTVTRATRFKNALTFDGGIGQAEPTKAPSAPGRPVYAIEARGKLLNYFDDGVWAATTGDATLAYRGRDPSSLSWTPLLSNAIRSMAFNRQERVLVVYDWATSTSPRSWELNFQALNLPTVAGKTIKVVNGPASACIDVYGPNGNVSTSSGFPVAPENRMPDHHRAQFKVSAASTQLVSVTVIREDCRSVPVNVNFNASTASVVVNGGKALSFDQKRVDLYLP